MLRRTRKHRPSAPSRRGRYARPQLEALESRTLPALLSFASTDVPLAIHDETTVTSDLAVPAHRRIIDLSVKLDVTHSFDSDLTVKLKAPDSRQIQLFSQVGDDGQDFSATVLDDRADVAIADGTAPFTGRFRPDEPLATFAGLDLAGTWQLSVTDGFAGDEGTLNGWSLEALTDVPLVQYASQVVDFTSQYSPSDWSAAQALGAPDTFAYGDRTTAWAAAEPNGGPETLTLGYA